MQANINSLSFEAVMSLLMEIAQAEELKVAPPLSRMGYLLGGCCVGFFAHIGGFQGLLIGLVLGIFVCYKISTQFKLVKEVLEEMGEEDKNKLYAKVKRFLPNNVGREAQVQITPAIKNELREILFTFLDQNMNYKKIQ